MKRVSVDGNSSSGEPEDVLFGSGYRRAGEGAPWASLAAAIGAAGEAGRSTLLISHHFALSLC